jgi:hypothetical protein
MARTLFSWPPLNEVLAKYLSFSTPVSLGIAVSGIR